MIAFIFRKKRLVAGKVHRSKVWYARIGPDRQHLKTVKLDVKEEQVANQKLAELGTVSKL